MPPAASGRLMAHLQHCPLAVLDSIEMPGEPFEHVYFPQSGIISLVASTPKYRLEVGIIGRESMTGVWLLLGASRAPHECFVQVAGDALRIKTAELLAALRDEPDLHFHFLQSVQSLLVQTAQTALSNGRCTIEQRLARWLLMSQDRLGGHDVPLTHDFLSLMLGVHRPGVTIALQSLEGAGAIRNPRGMVTIVHRDKLEEIAGGCYRRETDFPDGKQAEPVY